AVLPLTMTNIPNTDEFLRLKNVIIDKFDQENWLELGMVTGAIDKVEGHHRLLRSLSWNDSDYGGNALEVLMSICAVNADNFNKLKDYVDKRFPEDNEIFISSKPSTHKITFSPAVFEVPTASVDNNLVSVMMPF